MLLNEMSITKKPGNPLGDYIYERIAERRRVRGERFWSQRELARRAGISSGAISMIMNGLVTPEYETLEKIAAALEIDPSPLFELAGLRAESLEFDPAVTYIAQRLSDLPDWLKDEALTGVRGVIEGYWSVAEKAENLFRVLDFLEDPDFAGIEPSRLTPESRKRLERIAFGDASIKEMAQVAREILQAKDWSSTGQASPGGAEEIE